MDATAADHCLKRCAVVRRPQHRAMSLPAPFDTGLLDITDYRFMEEVADDSWGASSSEEALGPDCTGIVLHHLFGGVENDQVESSSSSHAMLCDPHSGFACC
jgi:hypothetical protein